ncbi:MAG: ACT domain-containing protein [Christensenellales bacterium]
MKKAIVTVIGTDKVGIIAAVSTKLLEYGINIMDISQTILQEYFAMVMLVDISTIPVSFHTLKQELAELGERLELSVRIQSAEIFDAMHKV